MPQAFLSGDRNLCQSAQNGSDKLLGLDSQANSLGGAYAASGTAYVNGNNDLRLGGLTTANAPGWAIGKPAMHSAGNQSGAGNILLCDGSAQQCSSAKFYSEYLPNAADGSCTSGNLAAMYVTLLFPNKVK